MAKCDGCGHTMFGGIKSGDQVFCKEPCQKKWYRSNLLIHPITGGLKKAVDGVLKGESPLFAAETAPGHALVGTQDTVMHVTAGLFGSKAQGFAYHDIGEIKRGMTVAGITSIAITGGQPSTTVTVQLHEDMVKTGLEPILLMILEKNAAVRMNGLGLPNPNHTSSGNSGPTYTMKGVQDLLEVYPEKVCITPQGVLGFLNKGLKGTKEISISSIAAIQFKAAGLTSGYLEFSLPGGRESKGGLFAATKDENTFMFRGHPGENELAREIKEFIEAKGRELRQPQVVVQTVAATAVDIPGQIKKLAELRDSGILTEDEFQAKKVQLLEKM